MQRPIEIIWFERIMFGTLALGAINLWAAWSSVDAVAGPVLPLTFAVALWALFAALILLVSRRRSNMAKWILIGLAVVGLPMFLRHVIDGKYLGVGMIGFIQTVGQLLAYALLFMRGSRDWLKRDVARI